MIDDDQSVERVQVIGQGKAEQGRAGQGNSESDTAAVAGAPTRHKVR